MTVSRATAVALAVTATALSSTACLGLDEPETAAKAPPAETAEPAAKAPPRGWKTIGGPDNGVRISVPPGWVDIAISNGEAAAGLDRLGLKGPDREVMRRSIAQLQQHKGLFAVLAASTSTAFATNVNALCTPSEGGSPEQLETATRAGLARTGAQNVETAVAAVGGRPGVRSGYEMASDLGRLSGRQGQVIDGDRVCTVTMTAKRGTLPGNTEDVIDTMEAL